MEGVMQRLFGFSAACLGFIALVLLVIWVMGGFENVHLSLAGWIAYMLGVVLTSVLGVVLMALVFHSDRSGRDERAGELRREVDGKGVTGPSSDRGFADLARVRVASVAAG